MDPSDLEAIANVLAPPIQAEIQRVVSEAIAATRAETSHTLGVILNQLELQQQAIMQVGANATDGLFGAAMQEAYQRFVTGEAARLGVTLGELKRARDELEKT